MWFPTEADVGDVRRTIEDDSRAMGLPLRAGELVPGAVSAVLARARDGPFPPFYVPSLALRVAFILRGLVAGHAFADGNKRTEWAVALLTMERNGHEIALGSASTAEQLLLRIATGGIEVLDLAALWNTAMRPLKSIRKP